MMTFSNICMSSSHHLTFGMHLFWTMAFHLLSLRNFTQKLMILCQGTPHLMNLEIFTKDFYSTWMSTGIQALQTLGSTLFILIFTRAILLRKIGSFSGLILDGSPNKLSKTLTRLLPGLEVLSLNMIT